jgi:hypothetical protein
MKKMYLSIAAAITMTMALGSCSKCVVCTKSASPEIRVCEKDYSSNTQYGVVVDGYELSGYSCK